MACSLHNKCTTLMEAALSLIEFGGEFGYYLSPDGGEVSTLAWFDHFIRIVLFDALAQFKNAGHPHKSPKESSS